MIEVTEQRQQINPRNAEEEVQAILYKRYNDASKNHIVGMIEAMTKEPEWVIEQLERLIGDDIPRES